MPTWMFAMYLSFSLKLIGLTMMLSIVGCATTKEKRTVDLTQEGYLIAQRANLFNYPLHELGPVVDGEYVREVNHYSDSALVITPIKAGTHSLSWHTISRDVTIEAGKATNIGLLVTDSSIENKKTVHAPGTPVFLDNTFEIHRVFEQREPEIYNTLVGDKIIHDIQGVASQEWLSKLRYKAIRSRVMRDDSYWENNTSRYVTASIGGIAEIEKGIDGKFRLTELLNIGLTPNLNECVTKQLRAACIIGKQEYLLVNDGDVTVNSVSKEVTLNSSFVFGKAGIVLVDTFMNFHISVDNGVSWKVFDDVMRPDEINTNRFGRQRINKIKFMEKPTGFYAYERNRTHESKDKHSVIVNFDMDKMSIEAIAFPDDATNINVVSVTSAGVLVLHGADFWGSNGILYTKKHGESEWSKSLLNDSTCSQIVFGDSEGRHVEVYCSNGDPYKEYLTTLISDANVYSSDDGGLTWIPIFYGQSLFH
jgi:hypothetical protein